MSERPTLTKRVRLEGPHQVAHKHCGYCGTELASDFCATGSVIEGVQSFIRKGVIRIWADFVETAKKVTYVKRRKCFLCDRCIAEYRCIEIQGKLHELVKVDFRPAGETLIPQREWIPEQPYTKPGQQISRSVRKC